jgi:hypothetical protein
MSIADVARCGARTRNGAGPCRQPGMAPSGRCRLHGGKSPRGLASPLTKTGRYSRDLPTRVAARYESALADPELLSVRDDIALLQGSIQQVMAEIREAEARPDFDAILGMVERISDGWRGWDWTRMSSELEALKDAITGQRQARAAMREVRELIREKAILVAQENRILVDREQMITVEQFLMAMRAMGAAVRRLVDDPEKLRLIEAEFRRLADRPDRGRA